MVDLTGVTRHARLLDQKRFGVAGLEFCSHLNDHVHTLTWVAWGKPFLKDRMDIGHQEVVAVEKLAVLFFKVEEKRLGGGDGHPWALFLDPVHGPLDVLRQVSSGVQAFVADNDRSNQGRVLFGGLDDVVDLGLG